MQPDTRRTDRSSHILNTSANLLGLCFIVLTSIKVQKLGSTTFIDELTAIAIVLFMISCILSFLSIRSRTQLTKLESIADIIFFMGLFFLFGTTILITLNIIS